MIETSLLERSRYGGSDRLNSRLRAAKSRDYLKEGTPTTKGISIQEHFHIIATLNPLLSFSKTTIIDRIALFAQQSEELSERYVRYDLQANM